MDSTNSLTENKTEQEVGHNVALQSLNDKNALLTQELSLKYSEIQDLNYSLFKLQNDLISIEESVTQSQLKRGCDESKVDPDYIVDVKSKLLNELDEIKFQSVFSGALTNAENTISVEELQLTIATLQADNKRLFAAVGPLHQELKVIDLAIAQKDERILYLQNNIAQQSKQLARVRWDRAICRVICNNTKNREKIRIVNSRSEKEQHFQNSSQQSDFEKENVRLRTVVAETKEMLKTHQDKVNDMLQLSLQEVLCVPIQNWIHLNQWNLFEPSRRVGEVISCVSQQTVDKQWREMNTVPMMYSGKKYDVLVNKKIKLENKKHDQLLESQPNYITAKTSNALFVQNTSLLVKGVDVKVLILSLHHNMFFLISFSSKFLDSNQISVLRQLYVVFATATICLQSRVT